jgi:hypothetical protein
MIGKLLQSVHLPLLLLAQRFLLATRLGLVRLQLAELVKQRLQRQWQRQAQRVGIGHRAQRLHHSAILKELERVRKGQRNVLTIRGHLQFNIKKQK